MSVSFTQFLRPDGRRENVTVDRPPEIEALARALQESGYRLEIEVLRTGQVHMECCGPVEDGEDGSLASVLCENGPAVLDAVDELITTAASRMRGVEA